MSLLSIDITKNRRLSLREVRLPALARKVEPGPIIQKEIPPTEEDIVYSKLVSKNPILELLVSKLGLVSEETGKELRKVAYPIDITPDNICKLAEEVIPGQDSFTKPEILSRIIQATDVNQEKAQEGFKLMLETGAIEQTINPQRYCLGSSTPF